MRIALFIHAMHGGGAERQMSYLASELVRQRYSVCLFTLAPESPSDYACDARVQRRCLELVVPSGGWLGGLMANRTRILALRRAVQNWGAHLAISFCDTNNILAGLALGNTLPLIVCERSDPRRQRLSKSWEFLRVRAYRQAAGVVAQTPSITEYLRDRLGNPSPRPWLETIPSAIVLPELSLDAIQSARDRAPSRRLLMLGRLSSEKKIDRGLRAWASLAARHPEWVLRIVGDGPQRSELESLASKLGVSGQVEFVGWSKDVWQEYRDAHVYVLTSEYEGYPQALIEAMASGLPVVAWRCSDAVTELISDVTLGRTVSDSDALEKSLQEFLSDDSLRRAVGDAAAKQAANYAWERIAPRWLAVIARASKR